MPEPGFCRGLAACPPDRCLDSSTLPMPCAPLDARSPVPYTVEAPSLYCYRNSAVRAAGGWGAGREGG